MTFMHDLTEFTPQNVSKGLILLFAVIVYRTCIRTRLVSSTAVRIGLGGGGGLECRTENFRRPCPDQNLPSVEIGPVTNDPET
jgi:hypothetical protein